MGAAAQRLGSAIRSELRVAPAGDVRRTTEGGETQPDPGRSPQRLRRPALEVGGRRSEVGGLAPTPLTSDLPRYRGPPAQLLSNALAESPILDRIDALVEEEHRVWSESEAGRLDEQGHGRLEAIRGELDRCWDALRRRRADPNAPAVRPQVPDPPNELEGPEPPHLEHGVHTDEPAPDPDLPRDIP